MQSQQKRLKWSRGETAEALEERTDTGITQASVEIMENCIPDIYGNISRRPALKPIPISNTFSSTISTAGTGFSTDTTYIIPFYYTEHDYYLIGFNSTNIELLRIKNGQIVKKQFLGQNVSDITSYAQQNNYMVIATKTANYELRITDTNGTDFTASIETWKFSAGWYAPYGTKTRTVTPQNIPNLNFTGGFSNYAYSDEISSVIYSIINTSVNFSNLNLIEELMPEGSIIKLPNIGSYFRIEGYDVGAANSRMAYNLQFDGVLNPNDSIPSTGTYCKIVRVGSFDHLEVYINGVKSDAYPMVAGTNGERLIVKNSNVTSGISYTVITATYGTMGGHTIVTSLTMSNWAELASATLYAYGALLTPVADENANDSTVTVEYGYESLQPTDWDTPYPHPKKLVFNQQRLWAGGWAFSATEEYSLVIGSQIARYNDFENDYNQENEPITVDILTQFKEKIVHLIDYNGLKIMTNSFEYAYDSGGVVKQSANGSYEYCEPIVFDSLCLYIDSTGYQVKAMQYEFQSNIFNSSTINQAAPHDLVWFPDCMATFEDKINNTGKYLFVLNKYTKSILNPQGEPCPRMAVCNFVPQNQANIWSRWEFPETSFLGINNNSVLRHIVNLKNETIFFIIADTTIKPTGENEGLGNRQIIPAVLDFNGTCDYEANITNNQIIINQHTTTLGTVVKTVLANSTLDIFSQGEYKLSATTNALGYITEDISQLTNVQAGYKINARIVSHPIDVSGKTKSIKKRIGKTQMSVHDTPAGAITINGKTGYMNPAGDHISFYGVTGMKDEIKYTLTNINGAMFHLESLLMNVEYGTLDS